MKKFRLSVCKGPDCKLGGADQVFRAVADALAQRGLQPKCHAFRGGCYGLCHMGPNLVIREDGLRPRDPLSREDFQLMGWDDEVHYGGVTVDKVARIVEEHIGREQPVSEWVGDQGGPGPALCCTRGRRRLALPPRTCCASGR